MYIFHFNIEITTKEPNGGMKHKEITVKKGRQEIWGENWSGGPRNE